MTRPVRNTDDRHITSHGYARVRVGIGHPLADSRGFAYEHLVVWTSAGRPAPKRNELLHHRNHDRQDNRLGNLRKITRSAHSKLHAMAAKRRKDGTFARRAA